MWQFCGILSNYHHHGQRKCASNDRNNTGWVNVGGAVASRTRLASCVAVIRVARVTSATALIIKTQVITAAVTQIGGAAGVTESGRA